MKFSNNTIIVDNYPHPSEYLLYNTRTQAMAVIDRSFKEMIETDVDLTASGDCADDLTALRQMGMVVTCDEEDEQKLKAHMKQIKSSIDRRSLPVTILTTYACNLKCTYCFEEASRVNEKMEGPIQEHVISWLKSKIDQHNYQKLYVTFYGGEPLVNKPAIEKIATHMQQWCGTRGKSFKFMLQTNGYLMTPELIDRYLAWGLDQVRISIDGVRDEHDRYRPLRKGGGTFDVIVKNIIDCVDKVKIGISVSYENGNLEKIEELMDYLDQQGILHKLGRFLFSPIHATLGPTGHPELIQNSACMCNYDDDNLIDSNRKIISYMKARGLPMRSGMSTSVCPVTRDEAGCTIDQKGDIYKCNSMLGHPELSTGNVIESAYNPQHHEFLHLDVWKQCPADCTYMPMCSGGCRLSSFLNNQNFKTATCHKPYLNKMARELIIKDYESMMAKQQGKQTKELVP